MAPASVTSLIHRRKMVKHAAEMKLAYQFWNEARVPEMLPLLDRNRPGPGEEDLRSFVWYYLRRLREGSRFCLRGHFGLIFPFLCPLLFTLGCSKYPHNVFQKTTSPEAAAAPGDVQGKGAADIDNGNEAEAKRTHIASTVQGKRITAKLSPDRSKALWARYLDGDQDIYVSDPDGSNATNSTNEYHRWSWSLAVCAASARGRSGERAMMTRAVADFQRWSKTKVRLCRQNRAAWLT